MPKLKKYLIPSLTSVIVLVILLLPVLSFAAEWKGLVACKEDCDFGDLMQLINKVINFILVSMAIPIAAIMFAYAGFLLVTAQGGEAKSTAKTIFTNTVFGLLLAVGSWIIINTLLSILGYEGSWIGFIKPL